MVSNRIVKYQIKLFLRQTSSNLPFKKNHNTSLVFFCNSVIGYNPDLSIAENLSNPDSNGKLRLQTNYATCELLGLGLAMEAVKTKTNATGYNIYCTNECNFF